MKSQKIASVKRPLTLRKGPKNKIVKLPKRWQLQTAKTHFSKLVKAATEKGPQQVTVHGKPAVMVLSAVQYAELTKPKLSLYEFMQQSPLADLEVEFKRQDSLTRDIEL